MAAAAPPTYTAAHRAVKHRLPISRTCSMHGIHTQTRTRGACNRERAERVQDASLSLGRRLLSEPWPLSAGRAQGAPLCIQTRCCGGGEAAWVVFFRWDVGRKVAQRFSRVCVGLFSTRRRVFLRVGMLAVSRPGDFVGETKEWLCGFLFRGG